MKDSVKYPKNMKYPNGFYNKIEYWTGMLLAAVEAGNMENIQYASKKLEYFVGRQQELNNG